MKKIQVFIALVLVTLISSCSKNDETPIIAPTNFDEIKISDIQAKNSLLSNTEINASDATGIKWEDGSVFIFKTNTGIYGKFKVVTIMSPVNNYGLIIDVILFNADGTIKLTGNCVQVSGTFSCDLDIPVEQSLGIQSDFFWQRKTDFETLLVPKNGAVFLKYTF